MYAFKITVDHIEGKHDGSVGVIGPRAATDEHVLLLGSGGGTRFRMLDDDGGVCYEGKFIGDETGHEAFAPLDDFGTPNAGCTRIDYWEPGKGGGWKTL